MTERARGRREIGTGVDPDEPLVREAGVLSLRSVCTSDRLVACGPRAGVLPRTAVGGVLFAGPLFEMAFPRGVDGVVMRALRSTGPRTGGASGGATPERSDDAEVLGVRPTIDDALVCAPLVELSVDRAVALLDDTGGTTGVARPVGADAAGTDDEGTDDMVRWLPSLPRAGSIGDIVNAERPPVSMRRKAAP